MKQEIPVTLDDVTYNLVFEAKAIFEAERLTGKQLITGLSEQVVNRPSCDDVCSMFYAAAKARHPGLTIEAIQKHLDKPSFPEMRDQMMNMHAAVLSAWFAGAPKPKVDDGEANPTQDQS